MKQITLVEDIRNYAQNIVDTVREPLLILDATLRVQSANRAFYQTFHVSPRETEGRLIYELGNGQWDIPDLRTLLEDIVPKSSVFDDFELEHTFPVIGRRVMLLNARKLQAGQHGELLVLAMEDVTARRRAEEALLKAGALQSAIFNSANFSSIATDEKGVIQIFNVGAERMLGYLLIGTDNTARKQPEAERMLLDQRVRDQQFYTRSLNPSTFDLPVLLKDLEMMFRVRTDEKKLSFSVEMIGDVPQYIVTDINAEGFHYQKLLDLFSRGAIP